MDVSIILQLNESAFSNKKTGIFENILAKNLWSCNEIRNSLVGLFLDTVQSHKIFQSGRKLLCKKHWNKITSKRDAQRIFIFNKSKTFQKEISKGPRFFVFQKHIKISTLKLCRFSVHWYCIKKVNQSDVFFIDWNYFEKSTSNWRRFFAHWNYVRACWLKWIWFFLNKNYVKESTSK